MVTRFIWPAVPHRHAALLEATISAIRPVNPLSIRAAPAQRTANASATPLRHKPPPHNEPPSQISVVIRRNSPSRRTSVPPPWLSLVAVAPVAIARCCHPSLVPIADVHRCRPSLVPVAVAAIEVAIVTVVVATAHCCCCCAMQGKLTMGRESSQLGESAQLRETVQWRETEGEIAMEGESAMDGESLSSKTGWKICLITPTNRLREGKF